MPPRRKLTAVPSTPPAPEPERAPDLRIAVAEAIKDMGWLSKSDKALAALAQRQAEEIEKAIDRMQELEDIAVEAAGRVDIYKRLDKLQAMCEVTKTVGWLGPQLQGVLRDLGGTPAARKAMGTEKPVGGRLAQIKKDAAARKDNA